MSEWITNCSDPSAWLAVLNAYWRPVPGGCREWVGRLDRNGYGKFRFREGERRRYTGAHRAMWLAVRGDIPDGMVIDHLCRNRACVNVEHLELVTVKVNTIRGVDAGHGAGRPPTGCALHGHEDGYSLSGGDGYSRWTCRICRRERVRAYKLRKKAAA